LAGELGPRRLWGPVGGGGNQAEEVSDLTKDELAFGGLFTLLMKLFVKTSVNTATC
jgi:hypothetical protein